jgi:hypothetical protein
MTVSDPTGDPALDLKLETMKVLAGDLLKSYENLINVAGQVIAAAVTARTTMILAGDTRDPRLGAAFEMSMDQLDRVVGGFAQASRQVLGLQNQVQNGARDMLVKA